MVRLMFTAKFFGRSVLTVAVLAAILTTNAPGQQPVKPPPLPPINPAIARLEQTITGLRGPGWAIAVDGGKLAK